jgi:hypothetical protein
MTYPPCFDICPIGKELYDMAEQMGQTKDSREAFQAYSTLFCLEVQLKQGTCVKEWSRIAMDAGETAVRAWRRYTNNQEFYVRHNDIMNSHGRSIAALVAAMGTCMP